MLNLKFCPLCKNKGILSYNKLGTNPHVISEIFPSVKTEVAIISHYSLCQNCHVIFQNPRLSDHELSIYYSKGFYRRMTGLTDTQIINDEKNRAKKDAQIIKDILGKVNSHLDIGCGRGYLLQKVNAKTQVGVELEPEYIKFPNINKFSELRLLPKEKFELVSLIHVLEHEPYPFEYLKTIKKYISRKGYLVIEVPTWDSPGGPLRFPHLFHFEPDVMRLLLKRLNFKIINIEFTPHLLIFCQNITV